MYPDMISHFSFYIILTKGGCLSGSPALSPLLSVLSITASAVTAHAADQTNPWAIIARATFTKPAMFAPAT